MPDSKKKDVLLVLGSDSDFPKIKAVLEERIWDLNIRVDIMSCHRNPEDVRLLAISAFITGYYMVAMIGSKALASPGVFDAWAYYKKNPVRVAGVALGEPGSQALLAAQLSIVELPGQPVILNEDGGAYTGPEGLRDLLIRAEKGTLPPMKTNRTDKPAQPNYWRNF